MYTYMKTLWTNPAAARKAWATIIGMAFMLATSGLLPDVMWAQWAVAALTVLTTYSVRNDRPKVGEDNG